VLQPPELRFWHIAESLNEETKFCNRKGRGSCAIYSGYFQFNDTSNFKNLYKNYLNFFFFYSERERTYFSLKEKQYFLISSDRKFKASLGRFQHHCRGGGSCEVRKGVARLNTILLALRSNADYGLLNGEVSR
jgi:hypothetical protein